MNAKQADYSDQYCADADGQIKLASESGRLTLIHDWRITDFLEIM